MSSAKCWSPTSCRFIIIATVTPHGKPISSVLCGTTGLGEEDTDKQLGTEGVCEVDSPFEGMAAGGDEVGGGASGEG
jgi:hypothetical protein